MLGSNAPAVPADNAIARRGGSKVTATGRFFFNLKEGGQDVEPKSTSPTSGAVLLGLRNAPWHWLHFTPRSLLSLLLNTLLTLRWTATHPVPLPTEGIG